MITAAAATRGDLIAVTFNDGRPPMQVPAAWPELLEWVGGGGQIVAYAPSAGAVVVAIRVEAGRRINAIAPDHTQRNLTARAVELALTYPGLGFEDLPEPEKTEAAAGRVVWEGIKAIRVASNAIEATVAGMTAEQRAAFDPADEAHWSA